MLLASTLTAPRDEASRRAACEYGPLATVRWALGTAGAFPPIPRGWDWLRFALSESASVPVCDPAWRTRDVLALARLARDGEPDLMPILADALQDAGCDDERILGHCRE